MKKIFLTSRDQFSGKSALAIGLSLALKEEGHNVGYFKPIGRRFKFGDGKETDFDVQVVSKILNLKEDYKDICPILLDRDFILEDMTKEKRKEYLNKIMTSFKKISKDYEIIIIEGQRTNQTLASVGLCNPVLGRYLEAKSLLLTGGEAYTLIDDIFLQNEYFTANKAGINGVIFNNVKSYAIPLIKEYSPIVKNRCNIETLGIIPMNTKLIAPTIAEIFNRVGGELLEKSTTINLMRLCEHTLVGAMSPEHAVKYFRRTHNNLIITGGDRPDLIISALELPTTSCIILTGNIMPPNMVLTKAHEKNIPLILVPHDTHGTSEICRHTPGYITSENQEKIELAKKTVMEHVDTKKILEFF
ncbi:MAG: phosphotransacetylase family protein [Candidatus Lokiarchaeota archaeon]|nr:phosphotransacetylase family protein [Candidatus Lokiarchaeota archaeon]